MGLNDFKVYRGKDFNIRFYKDRCIHSAFCLRLLPTVFNLSARPWANPEGDSKEKILEVIKKCPSGALQYDVNDIEVEYEENKDSSTTIFKNQYNQIFIKGYLEIEALGEKIRSSRLTLCGCTKGNAKGNLCDLSCKKND